MTEAGNRVLIVDDHEGVANALCVALRADGRMAPLGPTGSVAEALTMAVGADAVVLDLNLLDSEGLDTLTAFRTGAPGVPVVVYSADEEGVRSAGSAADACVPKGELRSLLATLGSLLDLPASAG